jgi:hypothetical protein
MKDVAIKIICKTLTEAYNVLLNDKIALDFFAREGDWQTQYYAQKVKKVHAWEIEDRFKNKLKENLPPNAEIAMGDSFVLAKDKNNFFDIVVLDNPQGCYGPDNIYCEHFEALDTSLGLLKKAGGILIFNVKTEPFNYHDKKQWQTRRNNFYLLDDCSSLSKEFILEFYKEYLSDRGYQTNFAFFVNRPQESGLEALTIQITRNCDDN